MKINNNIISAVLMFAMVFSTSCNSWNNTAKGGAVGAGTGAAIGGLLGNKSGNTAEGAILGAALGGVTGAAIGRYMDKQKEDLERDLEDKAEVERVGEGILVTFESGLLFGFDSDNLDNEIKNELADFSNTLKNYEDTEVLIEGHTDNVGSDEYNMRLSKERAEAVHNYLVALGVDNSRLIEEGQGETEPVATNETDEGRSQNRRVEIAIYANDELKQKAKTGEI